MIADAAGSLLLRFACGHVQVQVANGEKDDGEKAQQVYKASVGKAWAGRDAWWDGPQHQLQQP